MNSSRRQFLALLHVLVVDNAAAARAAVRQVKAEGADFVKVCSRLNRQAYAAILDEARTVGLTVHGHGPDELTSKEVSNAGQRSIEHIHSLGLSVSTRETKRARPARLHPARSRAGEEHERGLDRHLRLRDGEPVRRQPDRRGDLAPAPDVGVAPAVRPRTLRPPGGSTASSPGAGSFHRRSGSRCSPTSRPP